MLAYKLLRKRKDGTLGPLFVGRELVIKPGEWYRARSDLPTGGLAYRPGFHCCRTPNAPHIKLRLSNGEIRVWCVVEVEDFEEYVRPASQGGAWLLCKRMRVLGPWKGKL